MSARTPNDIAYDLFPVVVAAVGGLEVVREDDVGAVVFLGPTPGHLGAVAVAELVAFVAFVAVGCCLEGHGQVELMDFNQLCR